MATTPPNVTAMPKPAAEPAKFATPRSRFISSQANISAHRRLMDSTEFQKAEDYTMLEFVRAVCVMAGSHDLNGAGADQAAAASFHMIMGAHQFMEVFHRLAEPYAVKPAAQEKDGNLDHTTN